jgi:hypothetical protein
MCTDQSACQILYRISTRFPNDNSTKLESEMRVHTGHWNADFNLGLPAKIPVDSKSK